MSAKLLPNFHELKDQKLHTILPSFPSPSHGGDLTATVLSVSTRASATFVGSSATIAAIFHRSTKIATNLSRDASLKLFCLQLSTNFVPLLGTDNVGRLGSNKPGQRNWSCLVTNCPDYPWSWWPKLRPRIRYLLITTACRPGSGRHGAAKRRSGRYSGEQEPR